MAGANEARLKAALLDVLIAFAEISPTQIDYERVNKAAKLLRKLDKKFDRSCRKLTSNYANR